MSIQDEYDQIRDDFDVASIIKDHEDYVELMDELVERYLELREFTIERGRWDRVQQPQYTFFDIEADDPFDFGLRGNDE